MMFREQMRKLYERHWLGTLDGVFDHHLYRNIVLHGCRAVYFPFPKVACSAVKKVIARELRLDLTGLIHELRYPTIQLWKLKRCYLYFKFAFARNPWDRLVSCYANKILKDPEYTQGEYENGIFRLWKKYGVFRAGMSFEEFVHAVCSIPDSESEAHFKSQCGMLRTRFGLLQPDYVGRFENLAADMEYVCRKIGIKEYQLDRVNTSNRGGSYRDYYSEKIRALAADRYAEDAVRFGYSF